MKGISVCLLSMSLVTAFSPHANLNMCLFS